MEIHLRKCPFSKCDRNKSVVGVAWAVSSSEGIFLDMTHPGDFNMLSLSQVF